MPRSVSIALIFFVCAFSCRGAAAQSGGAAALQAGGIRSLGPWGEQRIGIWVTRYGTGVPFFNVDAVEFRPWAKGLFDARQQHDLEPHARCKASGAIRQFLTPYGVEILEIEALQRLYIFDIGGPHTYREVFMDGRSHPADPTPTNYGHNIGWWDGDTLVVDSVGYNEDFWFERMGLPHTESVQVTEYFTRTDPETLEYRFVMHDPIAYAAPVEGQLTMAWREGEELFEYVCQQSNYAHDLMVNPEELRSFGRTSDIVP
ncbi:MAG TPA: hypothetical protein VKQ06_08475 [Gammaproteobacteria bacterium]|nr:hypothetical protein [Gammaproteobacteria bacterium]